MGMQVFCMTFDGSLLPTALKNSLKSALLHGASPTAGRSPQRGGCGCRSWSPAATPAKGVHVISKEVALCGARSLCKPSPGQARSTLESLEEEARRQPKADFLQ